MRGQEEGLQGLHDRRVKLVDLLTGVGNRHHADAGVIARDDGGGVEREPQARSDTVLQQEGLERRGVHHLLGDRTDKEGHWHAEA